MTRRHSRPPRHDSGRARPQRRARPKAKAVVHLTAAERAEKGKAARDASPRAEHGEWAPAADRRDPVELLEEQAASRVRELVPIRYGRMLVSPFTFFRGAAYPMAADLADAPRTGLDVQLCGDAHLSNFGAFGAPDRRLVFSINDFDETLPGPVRVGRQAAGGQLRGGRPRSRLRRQAAARRSTGRSARAYREAIREFAGDVEPRPLVLAHRRRRDRRAGGASTGPARTASGSSANVAKARSKDSLRALAKLTTTVDGEPRIASDPPLIVPIEEVAPAREEFDHAEFMRGVIRSYRRTLTPDRRQLLERFRYVHAARKVVGVGSVGARAWIVLMLGRDENDPLFLQLKEAQASVLEPYLGKSAFNHHGQRVVEGQRLTQAAGDIMLGWIRVADAGRRGAATSTSASSGTARAPRSSS